MKMIPAIAADPTAKINIEAAETSLAIFISGLQSLWIASIVSSIPVLIVSITKPNAIKMRTIKISV